MLLRANPNSADAYYIKIAKDKMSIEVQHYDVTLGKWTNIQFNLQQRMPQNFVFASDQAYHGNPLRILLSYFNQSDIPLVTIMFLSPDKKTVKKSLCFNEMNLIKQSPQGYSLTVQEERFFSANINQLNADKTKYFGMFARFRSTKVYPEWKLNDMYQHAQTENNRSRKLCVSLGWMHADGQLTQLGTDLKQEAENRGYKFVLK